MSRTHAPPAATFSIHPPVDDEPQRVTIYAGAVFASQEPRVIHTVLGSCIAVCLFDPVVSVGGMNHYMLVAPSDDGRETTPARFGIHAMDLLIGAVQKQGARRERLEAKIFGGARVLNLKGLAARVPDANVAFIRDFIASEGLRVAAWDVGGTLARSLRFQTWSGRAFVKRLDGVPAALRAAENRAVPVMGPTDDITLFEP